MSQILLQCGFIIYFILGRFWILTQWGLQLTSGSALTDHSWQYLRVIWAASDWAWVSLVQDKLLTHSTIALAPPTFFFYCFAVSSLDYFFLVSLPEMMCHSMNENNLIQVECENNSIVNKKDHIYHSVQTWSINAPHVDASHLCRTCWCMKWVAMSNLSS